MTKNRNQKWREKQAKTMRHEKEEEKKKAKLLKLWLDNQYLYMQPTSISIEKNPGCSMLQCKHKPGTGEININCNKKIL